MTVYAMVVIESKGREQKIEKENKILLTPSTRSRGRVLNFRDNVYVLQTKISNFGYLVPVCKLEFINGVKNITVKNKKKKSYL